MIFINLSFSKVYFLQSDSQYKFNLTHFGFPEIAKFKCNTYTPALSSISYFVSQKYYFFSLSFSEYYFFNSDFSSQIIRLCQYLMVI